MYRPGATFKSILSITRPIGQPYDLHIILDPDKTLDLKGSAVGVLYSRNLLLMDALWRSSKYGGGIQLALTLAHIFCIDY